MSDLFDEFVFSLQRFADETTIKYGDIKPYPTVANAKKNGYPLTDYGEVDWEKLLKDQPNNVYWPEDHLEFYMFDGENGKTTKVVKATVAYTVAEEEDPYGLTVVGAINKVIPDTSSTTIVFANTENLEEASATSTVNFSIQQPGFYISFVPAEESEDEEQVTKPQSIHFVNAGDKLVLDEETLNENDLLQNLYFGDNNPISSGSGYDAALEGFDISGLQPGPEKKPTYIQLTDTTGTFEIGDIYADQLNSRVDLNSDVTIEFDNPKPLGEDGEEEQIPAGNITFDLKGRLEINVENGAEVTVGGRSIYNYKSTYQSKTDIMLNGVAINLQTYEFVYQKSPDGSQGILRVDGYFRLPLLDEVIGEVIVPILSDDIRHGVQQFVINGKTYTTKNFGDAEGYNGFMLDSSMNVTGVVFSEEDNDATILFTDGKIPEGFKIYGYDPDHDPYAEGATNKKNFGTGVDAPTVTGNSATVGIRKYYDAETAMGLLNALSDAETAEDIAKARAALAEITKYSLIVSDGAVVKDSDGTEITVTCGKDNFVEIVFDILEDGKNNILGVVPSVDPLSDDEELPAALSAYDTLSFTVNDHAIASAASIQGLFFGNALNDSFGVMSLGGASQFVAIGSGQYVYGKGTEDNLNISLQSATDTVYALDSANRLVLASGKGSLTDATDLDGNAANDITYEYTTSGKAFFSLESGYVADRTYNSVTGTYELNFGGMQEASVIDKFVFVDKDDALKIDWSAYYEATNWTDSIGLNYPAGLAYSTDSLGNEVEELENQPGVLSPSYTVKMTQAYNDSVGTAQFSVSEFGSIPTAYIERVAEYVPEATVLASVGTVVGFGNEDSAGEVVFGSASGAAFHFDSDGNALGFDAKEGKVSIAGEAVDWLEQTANKPAFSINGSAVDIEGEITETSTIVGGEDWGEEAPVLVYDADEKSLFGYGTGVTVYDAGEQVKKVYAASIGTAASLDGELTDGKGTTYNYAAVGASQASRAYFTFDGTVATGFGFATVGDAISVTESMTAAGFSLIDDKTGKSITAPEVLKSVGGAAKDEYTITKKEDPYYGMSDFQEGNYVGFEDGASITFQKLDDDSTAAIEFDMNTPQKLHRITDLVKDDEVKVAGAASAVIFDSDTVKVSGDNVSYVYAKGASSADLKDVYGNVTIEQLGASMANVYTAAGKSGVGLYTFAINGVSGGEYYVGNFSVKGGTNNGVQFIIGSDSKVSEIKGINDTEFVMGYFTDMTKVNGKDLLISGDEGGMAVIGNKDADGLTGVFGLGGESVVVTDAAGASVFVVNQDSNITFGTSSTFAVAGESKVYVGFLADAKLTVKGISFLGANESVTGDFSTVEEINGGNKFEVVNDPDNSLTVVGNEDKDGISKIAGVGDGALITDVAGASFVQTDMVGSFSFGGNEAPFVVSGDSSVKFVMDKDAAAEVIGVDDFGVDDSGANIAATLEGALQGIAINGNSYPIAIENDADERFSYMIDAQGNATLGGVSGTDVVINATAGARTVQITGDGTYNYAPTAVPGVDENYVLEGGDSSVLFNIDEAGKLTISDIADGESITTDSLGEEAITFVAENGASAVIQIDGDDEVTVVNEGGAFVISNLSDSAVIAQADNVTDAWTEAFDSKLTVTDASGSSFTAEGTDDGVNYILDGAGKIVGVDDLDEDVTLRGALGGLSSVNGEEFSVTETPVENLGGDGEFAIVGGDSGIGAITELGGVVIVENAGGASKLSSDGDIVLLNKAADQNFLVLGVSGLTHDQITHAEISEDSQMQEIVFGQFGEVLTQSSDGVDFALDEEGKVTGISGVGSNEVLAGTFDDVTTINGQEFDIQGASGLVMQGTDGKDAVSAIVAIKGTSVAVKATAGASTVLAVGIDQITFGEDETFTMAAESGAVRAVGFILGDDGDVERIGLLDANESITGDFSDIKSVNTAEFDVEGDDELTIVGQEGLSSIAMIAGVGDSAIIANVAGASIVRTDAVGSFSFAGNDAPFAVAGDSSVDFMMVEGESAMVAGVNNFGDEGAATLEGALQGIAINGSTSAIDIDGDADDLFSYMVDENGENATLGGVGGASGAIVEIKATAGASFVQTNAAGTFVFASGQSFTTDDDSVTFKLNGDGQVVAVYGLDTGKQITGNFAEEIAVEGDSGLQGVQVDGDDDVTVYHGSLILKDISDLATIKVADDITEAWTDPLGEGDTLKVTDTDGHEFVVEGGDSNGVAFLLDGQAHINGVDSLGEGVMLTGSLSVLDKINGKEFSVTETPVENLGGDGEFAIVGGDSGIGAIVGLSGMVNVVNAGGASKLVSDGNIALNVAGKSVAVVIGVNGITPEQILGVDISEDSTEMDIVSQFAENIEQSDGAEFTLDEEGNVTGISGIGGNEVLGLRPENAITVNGQELDIQGVSGLVMQGTDGKDAVSAIVAIKGTSVAVKATAGASTVLAVGIDQITFGEDETFTMAAESGAVRAVGFILGDDGDVERIGLLDANESITGDFSDIKSVNTAEFDVEGDGELTIVGQEGLSAISKIAGVGDGAVLNNVAGAGIVETNEEGTFTFAGDSFIVVGDDNVKFVMDPDEDAKVVGVNEFGVEGQSAILDGKLNGIAINEIVPAIEVENDEDERLVYAIGADGKTFLGQVGGASVVIRGTAGASYVELVKDGKYTFANGGIAAEYAKTYELAGGDSSVIFNIEGNNAVEISDIDKNESITGDFSGTPTTFIAVDGTSAVIQIDGDDEITVENDAILIRNLSDSAVIVKADNVYEAWTDELSGDAIAVTDAGGKSYIVEGTDADGVKFVLDGQGNIIGVDDLDEGATLKGDLAGLSTINGEAFEVNDPDNFIAVVGASTGISEIQNVSDGTEVVAAGGADKIVTDEAGTFTIFGDSYAVENDDEVEFALDGDKVTGIDKLSGNVTAEGAILGGLSINGKNFDIVNDADDMVVFGNDAEDDISMISHVGAADDGTVTINNAAGASFIATDKTGSFTFTQNGATYTTDDDNLLFGRERTIDNLDEGKFVKGSFSDAIAVNGEVVQVTDDDNEVAVYGGDDNVSAIGEVDADATVGAWGSASAISVNGDGDYTFIGADDVEQKFTTSGDSAFVFVPNDASVIGGVEDFANGDLSFDTQGTSALNINGNDMTFASESIATLTIVDEDVVVVKGITGSVSGIVAGTAQVIGVEGDTEITINGKDIEVIDEDKQFNVLVHSGEADYVYDVDGDTTVNAADVSVRANATGSAHASENAFVIGGESYVMDDSKDVNDGFTFVTDENGVLTGVYSLEGGLVVGDGDWDGEINGNEIEIVDGGDSSPVTIGTDENGDIDSISGLTDGDAVNGALSGVSIHIPGSDDEDGTTVTINGQPYTIIGDEDGVDVQDGTVVGLDDEASLTGPTGKHTVNGKELDFGDTSGEKVAKGRYNKTDAYFEDENGRLIRLSTAIDSGEDDGFNIEDISGIPGDREVVPGLINKELSDSILATAGTSAAILDLDQPLKLFLDNKDVKETQEFDVSGYKYTKSIHLFEGPQAVTLNNDGGNLVHVEETANGAKAITLGDGGDVVVVDEVEGLQNAVAIIGGKSDDSIYVRNNVNTVIDLSEGGDDMILTFGKANARITLAGYDADEGDGAAIRVEEYLDENNSTAGSIAEGILNGTINFSEGTVNIDAPDGHSEIVVGTNGLGGQIVNLMTHATSGNDDKQAVGFTGEDGGVVNASEWDTPLIMVGNMDGDKEGSTMVGGAGSDTFFGGAGDDFRTGEGNDLVILEDDATRGGARVEINEGRATVKGANSTLAESTGDTIAIDASKLKGIEYDDVTGTLIIDGDGYYAEIADVDVYDGNYTEQTIEDTSTGEVYKVAIGTESSIIKVSEQEDLRPNVFFGENTAIDFSAYTGDALIDLKGDYLDDSIIDETVVLIDDDITTLIAGSGDMAFKGDDDNETFYAGSGNTYMYGDGGRNLMVGYNGLDKEGQTYFYVLGNADGAANTITGFNWVTDDNYTDTKKVTADVLLLDLDDNNLTRLDISGDDVVIEVTSKDGSDETESAVIVGAVGQDMIVDETIVQIGDDKLVFDQFADFYYAAGKNATVEVSSAIQDDVVLWLDDDETGKSFEGDIAVIDARKSSANAQLAGNDNDNVIYAGSGETSLWGGEGGDDLLVGAAGGRNTFYYSLGNGDDTIAGVQDGDLVALDINSLDDIDEISIDETAITIKMNDGDELTIVDNDKHVGIMVDNGEGGVDTYYTDEARRQQ